MEEKENIHEEFKSKLHSCQKENQLLKEEIKNKQKITETILNQNNQLLKFNHYFDQNRMEKKDGGYKIKEQKEKRNNSEQDGNQQITRTNKIPRKNNNLVTENKIKQSPTKKKKKIFIAGNSMRQSITGTCISRDHTVKIRPHLGATNFYM